MNNSSFRLGRLTAIAAATLSLSMTARAATPAVDAGSLLRQAEDGLKVQPIPQAPKRPEAITPTPAKPDVVTVSVSEFKFVGNTLLTNEQLARAVAPFLNRPLGFEALQEAVQATSNAYRDAGWVVRAFLPKQDVTQGVVTIQIIEARLGDVLLLGKPSARVPATRLVATVTAIQPKGQLLNGNNIDRALLLLDDLPGVTVSGSLVEGQRVGETDLSLIVTDEALLSANAAIDDNGSRSTGAYRGSLNFALNSPSGRGDLLIGNLLKTAGTQYSRLAYSVPAGYSGLRVGLHGSYLDYALVGNFASLAAKGTAASAGWDMSYPLLRSQMQNVTVNLSYDHKRFFNIANAAVSSDYVVNVTNLSLIADKFDGLGGGGANRLTLAFARGSVNLDGSPNRATDAAGPQTAGTYQKASVSLSRQQAINADLSLFVSASGQAADKNLDSSEKIYLGGASGVRAYPTSEAGGSVGQVYSVELRQRVAQNWLVTGFYDYGQIKVNHTPYGNASLNQYSLKGFGLSLSWQGPRGMDLKATVSRRIGDNPAANVANGMDSDGTLTRNRVWLNANFLF